MTDAIEAALRRHPAVRDAAIVRSGDDTLAYVVASPSNAMSEDEQARYVRRRQGIYDRLYGRETTDLAGWQSSYTGQPIPAEEMREWVDQTVARIQALSPRRVMEIGCGTGLLLARIAPACEHYLGTDASQLAIDFVQSRTTALPQVSLAQRFADDFEGIAPGSFDVIVINSVVQYFPTLAYLLDVIDRAITALADGGTIFIGDVRDSRLRAALHASVELARAAPAASLEDVQRNIERRASQDEELVFDPELFFHLPRRFPRLRYARVDYKRGRYHNELTSYRYDVTLHVGARVSTATAIDQIDWSDLETARRFVAASSSPVLCVANVPDARVHAALVARARINGGTVGELREELARLEPGIDPDDLATLGDAAGYTTAITPSRIAGTFDVLMWRADLAPELAWSTRPLGELPLEELATRPLARPLAYQLTRELQRWLAEQLPGQAIKIVTLDAIPRTPDGEVDRASLPGGPP